MGQQGVAHRDWPGHRSPSTLCGSSATDGRRTAFVKYFLSALRVKHIDVELTVDVYEAQWREAPLYRGRNE